MKCRYLRTTDGFQVGSNNELTPVPTFLCTWPCERVEQAPQWVRLRIGGGNAINPRQECGTCECFEKSEGSP